MKEYTMTYAFFAMLSVFTGLVIGFLIGILF
jgi:hypothetical protein